MGEADTPCSWTAHACTVERSVLPNGFLAESQQGFVLLLTRQDYSRIHTAENKIEPKQSWKGRMVSEEYRC